jgi:hypothetical protein
MVLYPQHHGNASVDFAATGGDARGLLQPARAVSASPTASADMPARSSVVTPKLCARWRALAERAVLRRSVSLAAPVAWRRPVCSCGAGPSVRL